MIAANLNVIKAPAKGIGREGMGTTLTAAILEGERLIIAQVGDSRAYLLHEGKLQQLTRDHSLMADMIEAGQLTEAEARVHPNRSVITRAIGSDPHMQPDIYELNVETGDRILLCSDGICTMIEDPRSSTLWATAALRRNAPTIWWLPRLRQVGSITQLPWWWTLKDFARCANAKHSANRRFSTRSWS